MTELTLDLAIPRLKANEVRLNTFVNGDDSATVTTSEGATVPSVAKLAKQIADDAAALIAAKDAEINDGAESLLASATTAKDDAVAARNAAYTARDTAIASASTATAAKDTAVAAKNDALAAVAGISTDLSTGIHGADEVTTIDGDSEWGFWNKLTSGLSRIKHTNLLGLFRLTVQNWLTQTGQYAYFARSTAPTGWLKADGRSIGNASSGATALASDEALDLYVLLWNQFSNSVLPIQNSAGLATPRGLSALDDWNANKRMPLPDRRGSFQRAWDDGAGVDSGRTLGSYQGEMIGPHGHTASSAPAGSHTHTYGPVTAVYGANGQSYSDFRPSGGDTNRNTVSLTVSTAPDHTHGITVNTNSGTENRPANYADLLCIKL